MANWTEQKERSSPLALKIICWMALSLSRGFARLWLWPITLYFFLSSARVRFASREYLRRVLNEPVSLLHVFRHIYHFACVILDRVYFLTDQFERFTLRVHGEAILDAAMAKNKGVILLGAHVGSFDALRCLAISRQKLPLKILMYPTHNAMIAKIIDELNPELRQSVINLADGSALLQMKEALERGDLVGMLGDRVLINEKSVSCQLLGDQVAFPAGPFSIAAMLGVPVVSFFGVYRGGNRYDIDFSLLYDGQRVSRAQRNAVVNAQTQNYAHKIEEKIKQYPYNWFNFYDYWCDGKKADNKGRNQQ